MKEIQIISVCSCCLDTVKLFEKRAKDLKINVKITLIQDLQYVIEHNIINNPTIMIDGVIVYEDSIPPSEGEIDSILKSILI